jgi:hypothetical protein
MSTEQILSLLVAEKDRIEKAISALGGAKGQTRGAVAGRVRTAEQRAAQSEKMKAYWAARKAAGPKGKKR